MYILSIEYFAANNRSCAVHCRQFERPSMSNDEAAALGSEQLRARIAWYYYVAGLTQQEI